MPPTGPKRLTCERVHHHTPSPPFHNEFTELN